VPAKGRPKSDEFPLPEGYFWGPLSGPQQCISGEYPDEPQAWRNGLGRWQQALGLPVTKKWNDGQTPQAATTLQLERHWPMTPGIGYGTVHRGEWDAVFKLGWRLPAGWDASKVAMAEPVSSAAAIAVSEVRYERGGFGSGEDAYRGYLAKALDVMGITDQWARDNWTDGVLVAAFRESSYDPDAVNDWDSNAWGPRMPDGYPVNCSRGVLQTIPTTFASNHQPGTSTNIYDPVANTAAAMNYVMTRYGVLRDGSNLAAEVCQFNPHCRPRGWY
jgi:Transglycosylase SLT domain